MIQRIVKIVVLSFILFYVPIQGFAWGVLGHRITGQVAESYLSVKARKAIKKILGNESLAMAANYADFIKSDSTYKYIDNWHYVNIDSGMTAQQIELKLQSDTGTNVYNRIIFLTNELKREDLPNDKIVFYLKLLIHFVADLHQPMHVGQYKDLGGNLIRLTWFNQPSNLHRVWDEHLIEFQQLSYTEYAQAINFTTGNQLKTWQQAPISTWVTESYFIAQGLYREIGNKEPRLSYRYNFDHLNTLNQRLLIGGVRLAGLLNEIFK
ncbi:MAG: S1/P1 nuclease [Chitinophagaceae bacterium]|jgi:hypothetical protein|nr:S1/P1 nuclease [Chitinophagaceae bacterium]